MPWFLADSPCTKEWIRERFFLINRVGLLSSLLKQSFWCAAFPMLSTLGCCLTCFSYSCCLPLKEKNLFMLFKYSICNNIFGLVGSCFPLFIEFLVSNDWGYGLLDLSNSFRGKHGIVGSFSSHVLSFVHPYSFLSGARVFCCFLFICYVAQTWVSSLLKYLMKSPPYLL